MDGSSLTARDLIRGKVFPLGACLTSVGLACIAIGFLLLPAGLWWDESGWGYGYRFDFEVVDGMCIPIEHHGKPLDRGVGAAYSVENFGTLIKESPPLLEWLWKPRNVGLDVHTRQSILWPGQAGEPLPPDLPEQLAALVEEAINSGRDDFGVMEGARLELARELCLPIRVTASSGGVRLPRPELSQPVPRTRLMIVTVLTMLGAVCFAIGGWLVTRSIWTGLQSFRRARIGHCPRCGYPLNDLQRCPECGSSTQASGQFPS